MLRACAKCGANNRVPAARLSDQGKCGKCKGAVPALGAPVAVTDVAMFDELIRDAKVPVLVDFWAAWCGPCRMVAPEVERAASELRGRAVVLKVDTEQLPALARRYHVAGIPHFVVFRGGAPAFQQSGAVRAPQLVAWATT